MTDQPAGFRLMRHLAAWICVGFFASIASWPAVAQSPASCCSSLSEIQFRLMPPGQEIELSLTADSPTYALAERRQPFVALKIPDGFVGTTVQVRAFLSTAYLPSATAVIPEFIYFGADLNPVARQVTGTFQQAGGFWRSSVAGRAEVPPDARYIMVVAGDGSSGRPLINSASGRRTYSIPAAEFGDFTLRLFGEPARSP